MGAEALLRWNRDGDFMAPDQFLPSVERSELIAPLTDYVLDAALAAAAGWRAAGHPLGVSVNLATANLSEPDLPARVIAALRRHDVPPAALTLEITENAAVHDSVMADSVLAALDDAGVGLSVDDFGTGHSSLVRVARFPICEVKIDRSFVREMHSAKLPIVATTIELAHALGLRVVAEGIEDAGDAARPARARLRPRAGLSTCHARCLRRPSPRGSQNERAPRPARRPISLRTSRRMRAGEPARTSGVLGSGSAEREGQRLAVGAAAERFGRGDVLTERQRRAAVGLRGHERDQLRRSRSAAHCCHPRRRVPCVAVAKTCSGLVSVDVPLTSRPTPVVAGS